MKSYEGYTGIGSASRTSTKLVSSRKSPPSLTVSAGMSARSRSVRPARARVMSAPTSSPATVTPPGSKSLTNRALVIAALADGASALSNVLLADDTRVMIAAPKDG